MANDKKTSAIGKNSKWLKESEKIKSIQLSFDFDLAIDTAVRLAAARRHVPPSAIVREALGLSTVTPSRSRISLSFTNAELATLGERYGLDSSDKSKIKSCIAEQINDEFSNEEDIGMVQAELLRTQAKLAKVQKESEKIAASMKGLFKQDDSGDTG